MAVRKHGSITTDSEGETTFTGDTRDHSSSLMTTTTFDTTSSRLNATRIELERRQLSHSIQLLKLELAQKDMVIEALKTEHLNSTEELEEKLADITCERNLLQQKLRAMTHVYEEELRELRKQSEPCVSCQNKEVDFREPREYSTDGDAKDTKTEELKTALKKPLLTDGEYAKMYNCDETEMTLTELARVRLFEASRPFVIESERLCKEAQRLQACLSEAKIKYTEQAKALEECRAEVTQLMGQCEELTHINQTLAANNKYNNYKTDNFDIIKRERDELQREIDAIRRSFVEKEITEKVTEEEKRKLQEELSLARHSVALLKQDKEYLSKQVSETGTRCREVEERNSILQEQLSTIKQSKEELYEQFIRTRQQQKDEYGHQLSEELETIRNRTSLEIEQVRIQTREMFERENRVLQESKERADNDRDKVADRLREMEEKYEVLMTEFRQMQLSNEGQITDLQSELQMKVFDCQRGQLLQEETSKSLAIAQKDRNKYREKIESLTEDLRRLSLEKDAKLREYEASLKDKAQRLEIYESLEQELDDVVMQAAEMESEQDAERVLFSFGFGTSVPSTSRRRMQQSVQLARRVLKLERINSSLRQQLEAFDKDKKALEDKVVGMSTRIDLSHQPQKYLVETLQSRDNEITKIKNRNLALEARIRELERERKSLVETKNQMSLDLERLLNHNEELKIMKKMITVLTDEGKKQVCPTANLISMENIENTPPQPRPVIFTRHDQPLS